MKVVTITKYELDKIEECNLNYISEVLNGLWNTFEEAGLEEEQSRVSDVMADIDKILSHCIIVSE